MTATASTTDRRHCPSGRAATSLCRVLGFLLPLFLTAAALDAGAQEASWPESEPPPEECSDCHDGAADDVRLGPPHVLLAESSHSDEECESCHESIYMEDLDLEADNPHLEEPEPVDCAGCHEDEAEIYQKHGRLDVGEDPHLPKCWDCHGNHDILPSSDRGAHTHPINLPTTCRSCHSDVDLVKEHHILREKPIELYQSSVHG